MTSRRVFVISVALIIATLTVLAGCGRQNPAQDNVRKRRPTGEEKMNKIVLRVMAADDKVKSGQDLPLTLEVENKSDKKVKAEYMSAQKFDFEVRNDLGHLVWSWSAGRVFAEMLSSEDIGPGKTLKFEAVWPQTDVGGTPAPPGFYSIWGQWRARGYEKTANVEIKVIAK